MLRSKWTPLAAAALLSGSVLVFAADTPATPPAEHKTTKLVKPWSELSDLTDEQRSKIADLHAKANEEVNAIRSKEKQDILELLTADQKHQAAELEKMSKTTKAIAAPETQPAK
jgi:Spy/CpxP family protein refolding chaperone